MAEAKSVSTNPQPTLQSSLEELCRLIEDESVSVDEGELPGLKELIRDWFDDGTSVSVEAFSRRILKVFQESSHSEAYEQTVEQLPSQHKSLFEDFISNNKSAKEAGKQLIEARTSHLIAQDPANVVAQDAGGEVASNFETQALLRSESIEPKTNIIAQAADREFQNWGRTVKNTPAITFYPETVAEVQRIVAFAIKEKRGVRVSGFRHSWSPVFGRDNRFGQTNNGDVLISTLTEHNAGVLPNLTSLPTGLFQPRETELNRIDFRTGADVHGPDLQDGKRYVRVGTATTNEQFRRWCLTNNVTLPINIIEVEITFGGSNATICHGAGLRHQSLSDLVRCIEYVDARGQIQQVDMSNPAHLKAASGCFGLLGVVTHITFECDAMIAAVMRPVKLDVVDAIPPPPGMPDSEIPEPLRQSRTPAQKQKAQEDFERRANNDFYAEWFWFPYSTQVWVNTWSTDKNTDNVVEYPSPGKVFLQVVGTATVNMAQVIAKKIHVLKDEAHLQTALLSWLAMKNLDVRTDDQEPIRTLLPNALHFQRGVQNIRVRDLEIELPLHPKTGTTSVRDYANAQRAWWGAIKLCYDNVESSPMRMPLEMRIMGDSEVTMAPQRGHKLGTCAIEILTLAGVSDIWPRFAQQVLNRWLSYKDNDGKPLKVRPHWAKEWYGYQVDGKNWAVKLKNESYKDEIVEFKSLLADIGKQQGWELADLDIFSNKLLDYLFLKETTIEK